MVQISIFILSYMINMDYFDRNFIKCVLYWKWYFKSEVGLHYRLLIIVFFSLGKLKLHRDKNMKYRTTSKNYGIEKNWYTTPAIFCYINTDENEYLRKCKIYIFGIFFPVSYLPNIMVLVSLSCCKFWRKKLQHVSSLSFSNTKDWSFVS